MTQPVKKAAARLGPLAPAINSQPPWAMIAPNGTDLYFPTKQEDAITFARDHGAQPVESSSFPWQSILDNDGKINLGDDENGEDDETEAPADETPSEAPDGAESEQGGPTDPDAAPTPPVLAQPARKGRRKATPEPSLDRLGCPSPDVCWPVGLPDNCSYVTCVHGGWQVG